MKADAGFADKWYFRSFFCEQKEPKKLFIDTLPLAYSHRLEYANGKEVIKFFCFFVFKQRRLLNDVFSNKRTRENSASAAKSLAS